MLLYMEEKSILSNKILVFRVIRYVHIINQSITWFKNYGKYTMYHSNLEQRVSNDADSDQ